MTKRPDTGMFSFEGFDRPESNWFRMPNSWTNITAAINSIAEIKVVEYILRHTWGYQEYDLKKHITIDEFVNGRRRQDGSRMDQGTGLSERAVYDGLRKAALDGLIEEDVDNADRGRIKKYYSLRMRPRDGQLEAEQTPQQDLRPGVQSLHPPLQSLPTRGAASAPRTEKETLERNPALSNFERANANVDKWSGEGNESANRILDTPPLAVREVSAPSGRQPSSRATPPIAVVRGERRGRPPGTAKEREIVVAYLENFARELGDEAQLSSSVSQAINIFKVARVPQEQWPTLLYQARAVTKERSPQIKKKPTDPHQPFPAKIRMPYYMAVLRDLVGLGEGGN